MTRVLTIWLLLLLAACGSGKNLANGESDSDRSSVLQLSSFNHLISLPGYSRFEQSGLELKLISTKTDNLGMSHMRYQQLYRDLPLQYAELITHMKNGEVYRVDGQFAEHNISSTTPEISVEQAVAAATTFKRLNQPYTSDTHLLIAAMDETYDHLAWEVTIRKGLMRYIVLVDANTGLVLKEIAGIHYTK
jgi:Zn-dependent metalloprotease